MLRGLDRKTKKLSGCQDYTLWYRHQQNPETNLIIVGAKALEKIGKKEK